MKLIILFSILISISFAQTRPPDELLANYSTGVSVNTALQAIVTGSGTANQLTYWTATRNIASLSITTYPSLAEIAFVKGVTSAIQTQLNGKAASSHTHTIANVTGLQPALDAKQAILVSGTNIRPVNGQSLLGSTNLVIAADTTGLWSKVNNIVKSLIIGDIITGTAATIDSMIVDFRKNNYLRLDK